MPAPVEDTGADESLQFLNLHTQRGLDYAAFLGCGNKTPVGIYRNDIFQLYERHVLNKLKQR